MSRWRLSGEGADELFGGYTPIWPTVMRGRCAGSRRWPGTLALRLRASLPVSDEKIGFDYKVQRMLCGFAALTWATRTSIWNGTFSESEKKRLHLRNGHPPVGSLLATLPAQAAASGHLNRYLWLDQRYYLPDDILYKCDRMSMAHALEVRAPFLDHRIVEFAASLAGAFQNSRVRVEVRAAAADARTSCRPRSIKRPKEGFDIPAHEWFRGRPAAASAGHADPRGRGGIRTCFIGPNVERLIRKTSGAPC